MVNIEHGVPFMIKNEEQQFRAAVTVVSADNPASAALSGFK